MRAQAMIELNRSVLPDETFVNYVAYEKRSYDIRSNDRVDEGARMDIAYLRDVLERHSAKVEDAPIANAEALVHDVLDEMQGLSPRIKELSTRKWLAVVGFIGAAGATVVLFIIGRWELAIGALSTAAYLGVELGRILRGD